MQRNYKTTVAPRNRNQHVRYTRHLFYDTIAKRIQHAAAAERYKCKYTYYIYGVQYRGCGCVVAYSLFRCVPLINSDALAQKYKI